MKLSAADEAMLKDVHPHLVLVIHEAARITSIPFRVTEGKRSIEQQRRNVAKGVSWTMNSRHLTGHAVDIVPMVDINKDGRITVNEMYAWPLYYQLAPIIKKAAKNVAIPVEWGGDWKKNKDGPHWQLPSKLYPATPKLAGTLAHSAPLAAIQQGDPPTAPETENAARVKQTAVLSAAGVGTAGTVPTDSLGDIANALSGQQSEITSGDIFRVAIAVIILALVGYGIWRTWK